MPDSRIIASITLTVGSTEYRVVSAPPFVPRSAEKVDCSVLGEPYKRFLPSPQKELSPMAVTVAPASGSAGVPASGIVCACTLTTVCNTDTGPETYTSTFKAFIESATPHGGETGANRHATWEITLTPTGESLSDAKASSGNGK